MFYPSLLTASSPLLTLKMLSALVMRFRQLSVCRWEKTIYSASRLMYNSLVAVSNCLYNREVSHNLLSPTCV